jgi:putative ABC transport system permease protein
MIKHYFRTAWRNLVRNKFYTAINIVGLTMGLAVGMLITLWVQNELSYDRFHRDTKNIYRVLSNMGSGSDRQIWANSHAPMATFAKRDIPEIKNAVRISDNRDFSLFKYRNKQFSEEKKGYVDTSFFTVFDFKLLEGSAEDPFQGDYSVILTASAAKRYFNNDEAVGKILQADNKEHFVVAGVLEDFPENSSIKYDMLFPMSLHAKLVSGNGEGKDIEEDWGNFSYNTFLQLAPGTATSTVTDKLALMLRNHYRDVGIKDPYSLQPLADMHLYKTDGSEGLMQTVRFFLIVGILILIIACINYVNLSTARSLVRAKEVSIRKMIGAGKAQLFIQFIIETVLVFIFATITALLLAGLLMPVYNNIAGKNMAFSLLNPNIWMIVCITVLATLILSSIYPALLLSSFEPLKALKGKFSAGISAVFLRKVLVTTQFVFAVALITGTLIIDRQLTYIHEIELGYDKEHVFTFGMGDMQPHAQSVKAELLKQQSVLGVTCANDKIVNIGTTTGKTDWDGKDPNQRFFVHPLAVDEDFLPVFKLQLVAGRSFIGMASDSAHYILNETAVKEADITDPIGKRFKLWDIEGTIIGVVKDFHFASLKQKIAPAIFQYQPGSAEMYVKTTGKGASKAIAAAEELWKQYNAGFPFKYTFLDETYNNLYKSEQRTGTLFMAFSIVAILISCLGLFGLATYTAQVKTKEIGIRKIMGASITGIIQLLAKDFMKLVLLAILIATPLAWYAINQWLQDYAYSIKLQWWMFTLAGLLSVSIAMLTVSFQSIKAALMDPVKSLRSE